MPIRVMARNAWPSPSHKKHETMPVKKQKSRITAKALEAWRRIKRATADADSTAHRLGAPFTMSEK